MQLYTLMGILFLNVVTFVASQTGRKEAYPFHPVNNHIKQLYMHETAHWVHKFEISLTKELALRDSYDFVFSPFGTSLALTLLSMGARRRTLQIMREVLGFEILDISRKIGFYEFLHQLNDYQPLDFEIASAVFLPDMELESSVVDAIEIAFLSTIRKVNFFNPYEARAIINQWCAEHTRGHITNIVKLDDFAAPTSLILVDAIHFEGAWLDGFDPKQTRDMPFYCADGTIREVETMVGRHPLRYIEHAPTNSKIVELPLMGIQGPYNLSLILILPKDRNGLINLERNLNTLDVREILRHRVWSDVTINVPVLNIAATSDLIQPLKNIGLQILFDPNFADFGGFFERAASGAEQAYYREDFGSYYPGFYVNKIIQKAHIHIHEGRATNVPFGVANPLNKAEFIADHPFYGTVITTTDIPITVFTFRHSGIAKPTSSVDLRLEIS